jgi:mono/diheme cytochrome c family protein
MIGFSAAAVKWTDGRRTVLGGALRRWACLLLAPLASCEVRDVPRPTQAPSATQQGITRPLEVQPTPVTPARFADIGRPATAAEIRAWNLDVNASGTGLPAGRGTPAEGARVYAAQCASCHGARGEGIAPFPRLVGRDSSNFGFGRDPKLVKTVGSYWPYATTLFDYVNRAMPFAAPGTLTPDQVYGVVAWLLAENGIVSPTAVMDARTLPAVRMPARDRFVPDDRRGGSFR